MCSAVVDEAGPQEFVVVSKSKLMDHSDRIPYMGEEVEMVGFADMRMFSEPIWLKNEFQLVSKVEIDIQVRRNSSTKAGVSRW